MSRTGSPAIVLSGPKRPFDVRELLDGAQSGVRAFSDRPTTQLRINELLAVTRHEILSISPEQSWDPAILKKVAGFSHWMAMKGIRGREIATPAHTADLLVPFGGLPFRPDELRHMTDVPMKLIVIDRMHAFLPIDVHNHERGYVEVTQPLLVQALIGAFERFWERAHQPTVEPAFPMTPRERAVIDMLLRGHTDSATARQLRISERSITNVMRSLMDRVGARNRFQLGVALGSMGAVPPPAGAKPKGAVPPPPGAKPKGAVPPPPGAKSAGAGGGGTAT